MKKTLQQQCCALLLLLALLLGGSCTAAHARCNPIPFVKGAIVPDNAVFCVGEPVAWASEICYKPEECCSGYVRPNCFWDVTADNRYEIGDPILFSNGWCATLTLNGPAYHTIDGGMIVFDEPGTGTVTGSITEATPGCRECTRQDGQWTPTEANFNVIGGPVTASTDELRWYCGGFVPLRYFHRNVTATEQPAGVGYNWICHGPVKIISGQGNKEIMLEVTGASSSTGDIWATCVYTLNGVTCTAHSPTMTSRQPTRAIFNYNIDYRWTDIYAAPPDTHGYLSRIHYWLEDQFNQAMGDIYVGENFEDDRYDYWKPPQYPWKNIWPNPNAGGGDWPTADIFDNVGCGASPGVLYPDPMDPQWPGLTSTLIFDHTQHINFGGSSPMLGIDGCNLLTVKQTYYIDHGRHL